MTELDPDRALAVTYVPAARRAAVNALWHLDAALGRVISSGREPMLRQIKLVWWRDALQKLGSGPAPAEPVLQALSSHVVPAGLSGGDLAKLYEGWAVLLNEHALSEEDLDTYAAQRGGNLFSMSAKLLDRELTPDQKKGGEAWALVDLARHSGEPDAGAAIAAARQRDVKVRWAGELRFLGMLAVLACQDAASGGDLNPQGSPSRMVRMLRHRFTGR